MSKRSPPPNETVAGMEAIARIEGGAGIEGGAEPLDFAAELVRHQRRIYLFIGTMIANPADIEDVYQQACLSMWRRRDQLDSVRNFFAFACGFARNEALHLIRRDAKKGSVHLSEKLVAVIAEEVEREPEDDRYLNALGQCLEKLDPDSRELLKRRYSGLETVKAIAAELSISAASLTMRLQRIRRGLLQCVEKRLTTGDIR